MASLQHRYCNDWCHVCGSRKDQDFVEMWYPDNAEHSDEGSRYIRICYTCAFHLMKVAEGMVKSIRLVKEI